MFNTHDYPWTTVFKLLMRFNVSGLDYYYVCSAASMGSFHLMTSGHCIYNHDPNGDGNAADADWAGEVWAWAAQTDLVDPIGDPDHPYGPAKALYLRTYNGWIDSANLAHDMAYLTLDRRQGDHTGWMGREANAVTSALNFDGYPAEYPYVPPGTLVQYFGYDPGNIDSYTDFRIQLSAFVYGGHSGGPAWRYDGTSRWIQGVNSTSNRMGTAVETRLHADKFDDITDIMAEDESSRAPTARPDLVEYLFDTTAKNLLASSVQQGESFQVEYNVLNAGLRPPGRSRWISTSRPIPSSVPPTSTLEPRSSAAWIRSTTPIR